MNAIQEMRERQAARCESIFSESSFLQFKQLFEQAKDSVIGRDTQNYNRFDCLRAAHVCGLHRPQTRR